MVEGGLINAMALSPDGSAVALESLRPSDPSNLTRVWVKRLDGGPTQLVTPENRSSFEPIWTPDGRSLLFASDSDSGELIYRRRADGSGTAELVARVPRGAAGMAIHRDGNTLVVRGDAVATRRQELLRVRLGSDSSATPLFGVSGGESSPAFSPDGRWLALSRPKAGGRRSTSDPFPTWKPKNCRSRMMGGPPRVGTPRAENFST